MVNNVCHDRKNDSTIQAAARCRQPRRRVHPSTHASKMVTGGHGPKLHIHSSLVTGPSPTGSRDLQEPSLCLLAGRDAYTLNAKYTSNAFYESSYRKQQPNSTPRLSATCRMHSKQWHSVQHISFANCHSLNGHNSYAHTNTAYQYLAHIQRLSTILVKFRSLTAMCLAGLKNLLPSTEKSKKRNEWCKTGRMNRAGNQFNLRDSTPATLQPEHP